MSWSTTPSTREIGEPTASDHESVMTFDAGKTTYGIPVEHCRFVVHDKELTRTRLPSGCGSIETILFENQSTPLLDTHRIFGTESIFKESVDLIETLHARERDHIEWLEALEHSICTGTAFEKATDPHECDFGQWYDSFTTSDLLLSILLRAFNEPHHRIHALADRLLELRDQGDASQALRILNEEKATTLSLLRTLFEDSRRQIKNSIRRVILIVQTELGAAALKVDEITDLVPFRSEHFKQVTENKSMFGGELVLGFLRSEGRPTCVVLDCNALIHRGIG